MSLKFSVDMVAPRKNDPLFTPYCNIGLGFHSVNTKNGRIHISAQLMTELEIDEAINFLQSDLDSVRKEAKKRLVTAKRKLHERIKKEMEKSKSV